MTDRVCVVMPTYNERDNLEPTLTGVFVQNPGVDVLIVDDASPDGTGTLADVISKATNMAPQLSVRVKPGAQPSDVGFERDGKNAKVLYDAHVSTPDLKIANRINGCTMDSRVFVLHRKGKLGLGSAYVDGFTWALDHGYTLICEMDMDGSHRPDDLKRMLDRIEGNANIDLVVGSRRVPGGTTENWPWYRDLISRVGSQYARLMLGLKVRDMTSGFRVYRAGILRKVNLHPACGRRWRHRGGDADRVPRTRARRIEDGRVDRARGDEQGDALGVRAHASPAARPRRDPPRDHRRETPDRGRPRRCARRRARGRGRGGRRLIARVRVWSRAVEIVRVTGVWMCDYVQFCRKTRRSTQTELVFGR